MNIIDQINNSIDNKIVTHQESLTRIKDENTKTFIRGCIAGLRVTKLSIPLKENTILIINTKGITMENMENLKALVYGEELNDYHRSLAIQEFKELVQKNKDANEFIIDIANLLEMDTDSVGFDGISFTIDDFKDAIDDLIGKYV